MILGKERVEDEGTAQIWFTPQGPGTGQCRCALARLWSRQPVCPVQARNAPPAARARRAPPYQTTGTDDGILMNFSPCFVAWPAFS